MDYLFVLTVSTSSLASLSLLDAENLPTVNVGAHNNDTEYHRYLGTLQSPSPLNLSQNFSNDVELKPQVIKSKNIFIMVLHGKAILIGRLRYDIMIKQEKFKKGVSIYVIKLL